MVAKKRGRRVVRKSSRKVAKKTVRRTNLSDKIKLVINNLLLFIALSLVSFVLYRFIENKFLNDLFFIIAVVFGFIGVGFLIVLLVLMIMRMMSKRK